MLKYKFVCFGFLLFCACNSVSYNPNNYPQNPFFDIKAYFENEMDRSFSDSGVKKITVLDGKKEEVILDEINLKEELKLFAEANLNKVSWYEKYTIDTVENKSGGQMISYTAIEPELNTQKITIYKNNNSIDSIYIHNHLHSMIMDTDQYLKYDARRGYSVNINQESSLQKTKDYSITVEYQ